MNGLAQVYTYLGNYDEAEILCKEVLDVTKGTFFGEDPVGPLGIINVLGVLRREQKRYEEAEKLLTEARDKRQTALGPDHPATLESIHELAVLYIKQGDYDKAKPLLIEAVEGRRLKLGDTHPHTLESWHNLIELYEARGKPEKAKEWRAKLPQTEAMEE